MPLTPADVRNKQFSTTRLRPGYDEEEVDAFLDEVEAELDRLIQENEDLRGKLTECLRGKVPSVAAAPIVEPKPEMAAPIPEPPKPELQQPPPPQPHQQPEPEPALAALGMQQNTEDQAETATKMLALAQSTADQLIADSRREADETLGRARREADEILGKARRQAEQIVAESRARAEQLDRDAQERHRQVMGSLVQHREELERDVDNLRAFEREYRSRLKQYLEGQLRDLEAGATDGNPFPSPPSATGPQPAVQAGPHPDARNGQPGGAPATSGPNQFPPGPEVVQHAQHSGAGGFRPGDGPPRERR